MIIEGKTLSVELDVVRGLIQKNRISGDYFKEKAREKISNKLNGKRHFFDEIQDLLYAVTGKFRTELTNAFF